MAFNLVLVNVNYKKNLKKYDSWNRKFDLKLRQFQNRNWAGNCTIRSDDSVSIFKAIFIVFIYHATNFSTNFSVSSSAFKLFLHVYEHNCVDSSKTRTIYVLAFVYLSSDNVHKNVYGTVSTLKMLPLRYRQPTDLCGDSLPLSLPQTTLLTLSGLPSTLHLKDTVSPSSTSASLLNDTTLQEIKQLVN